MITPHVLVFCDCQLVDGVLVGCLFIYGITDKPKAEAVCGIALKPSGWKIQKADS